MCEVPIKNEFNIEELPFLQYSVLNLSSDRVTIISFKMCSTLLDDNKTKNHFKDF